MPNKSIIGIHKENKAKNNKEKGRSWVKLFMGKPLYNNNIFLKWNKYTLASQHHSVRSDLTAMSNQYNDK